MAESDRMRELLLRYQNADLKAFDELYHSLAEPLYRFLLGRCRNPREAEDALQETFLRIHKYILSYRPELSGYAWVIAIAQNVFLKSYGRRQRSAHESLNEDVASDEADAERQVIAADLLRELFQDLNEAERKLIIGRLVEEKDYEVLAKDLSLSGAAVRQRLSRVLKKWQKKE